MTARLSGWYAWRRIGSETVECVQYAEDTWFAARDEASRACGVEAMGLVCEPGEMVAYQFVVSGIPLDGFVVFRSLEEMRKQMGRT